MTFKRRTESRKAVMRKREVIELRHRINCVGWPCASAVINKERSLTARPGKHAGVQEHGTPDIVMFVIPGRPEWLRRKKNCGREYRTSASPLVPCTPQQYRRTMRVTVSISFSLFKSHVPFYVAFQLATSNRMTEEKAGHLYAVCLLPDAKARRRAGLTAPARARCRPVSSARC